MSDKKTVLIVDDDDDARVFIETVVSEVAKLDVIAASDGDTGLQKAKESVPDLVILDVMMPGKNGFVVFNEFKQDEKLASMPVIMLTGVSERSGIHFSAEDMGEYIGEKPVAFLDKPVDPQVLEETVRLALGL